MADPQPPAVSFHQLDTVLPQTRVLDPARTFGQGPPADTLPPRPAVPGFVVERVLGRGGMGVVYLARQTALDRPVALKVILANAHASADDRDRFHSEAKAVAALQHPNIVQVHEVGEHDGLPYCALEYVAGGSLDQYLAGKPQPPHAAAALVRTLAETLAAVHAKGLVHRDLKPANILLDGPQPAAAADPSAPVPRSGRRSAGTSSQRGRVDRYGTPKVTDFGLAKQLGLESGRTATGQAVGTPNYMAPEQARGDKGAIGPLVDVWALGAILYECLTGRVPFQGVNALETLHQVIYHVPVPLRQLQPGVPRDLETITHKCLSQEPGRRYASAQALADDLGRFLDGEPIQARPAGRLEKAWRLCRRNPAVTGLAAAVVLALVAGIVTTSWQLARALDAEAAARAAEAHARGEEAKAKQAQTEEAAARLASDRTLAFLLQVFRKPDPFQEGKKVTLYEVLIPALNDLAGQGALAPRPRAHLLAGLAQTFQSLGEPAQERQAREALHRIIAAEFGADHPQVLVNQRRLGTLLAEAGQQAEGIALLERLRAPMARVHGPDHPETLYLEGDLGQAYLNAGRLADALAQLERTHARVAQTQGADHPDTLNVAVRLATCTYQLGQYPRTVALLEAVRRTQEATLPADDVDRLETLVQLGLAYQALGRLDDAIRAHTTVRDRFLVHPGRDHPKALFAALNLANAYQAARRDREALPLYEEAAAALPKLLGPDHLDTLKALHGLAGAFRAVGRLPEAIALGQQVLERKQAVLGPDHFSTLATLANLAEATLEQGPPARAVPLLREAADRFTRVLGPEHANTLAVRGNYGKALFRAGRLTEAEALLRDTVPVAARVQGAGHPATVRLQAAWGMVLTQLKRAPEGIPLLEAAHAWAVATLPAENVERNDYAQWLATAYLAVKQYAKAEPLLAGRLAVIRKVLPPGSPGHVAALVDLAICRADGGMAAAAEPVWREALAYREKAEPDAWTTASTQGYLGQVLTDLGKYAEAEPLLLASQRALAAQFGGLGQPTPPHVLRAAFRLVQLYRAWDRPEELARWQAELVGEATRRHLAWPLLWGRPVW